MSTVALTPEKNNGPQRLTKSQRRLERLLKMAGKHALTSKKIIHITRMCWIFIQDDAGMMETLFRTLACSWTDWRKFKGACHYYIIHGGCSQGGERTGWLGYRKMDGNGGKNRIVLAI